MPDDMASVKQGLLPKEIIEKLKRVEKLSKRVREQLARARTRTDLGKAPVQAVRGWRNIAITLIDLGFWRTNGASWCQRLITPGSSRQ
jgi:hypothetical protein